MTPISVLGDAPASVVESLASVEVVDDGHADIVLVWFADPNARREMHRRARKDLVLIALIGDEEDRRSANESGATEALVWPEERDLLDARLHLIDRIGIAWGRRLKNQERRARRAMAELASTQDLLGRLINATPNPVIAADIQGRVLVFNRAAERALGYESSWARDQMHVTNIYADPAEARRVLAEIRNSSTGIVHELDVRLRDRAGEHIPVLLSAAEVYAADGMPMATVGVFEDQRMELSLRNRLEETTEQLINSEKHRAAMEVAGAAAHELNQPLTAIMGSLELVGMRGDLPEDVVDRLERVYGQLERMAQIVKSLHIRTRPPSIDYVGDTQIADLSRSRD